MQKACNLNEPTGILHLNTFPLPLEAFQRTLLQDYDVHRRYALYQAQEDALQPMRRLALLGHSMIGSWRSHGNDDVLLRAASGWLELVGLLRLTHRRPAFDIEQVTVEGRTIQVQETVVAQTPFASLVRFTKTGHGGRQPRILLVAPMSGHFATLLRGTVRTLLEDHEVYITDWHSARDVPLAEGPFGMDEYARHLIRFLHQIGPGAHLVAVCQPCVAALTAVARMSEDRDHCTPISMTLMAGPIDTRIAPTEVNRLAQSQPLDWFARKLITTVPSRYPGASRRVYPGFLQLAAFMAMNHVRHFGAFTRLLSERTRGETGSADAIRHFYQEYLATADLPAEFYLETVDLVFQRHALPRGELIFEGRPVRPQAIVRTLLLTVEGQRDDICAVGQTMAAHDLCSSLKPFMRRHYVQPGVGHYGVFSGSRWEQEIYPLVRELVFQAEERIGRRLPVGNGMT
jgi:polyhydroxyalkanoate depolymerase